MQELDELFGKKAAEFKPTEKTERDPIPTGTYDAVILATEVKATGDRPSASITFKIVAGEHDGRQVWANFSLNDQGVQFLFEALYKLGVQPPKTLTDLYDVLRTTVGNSVEIYCKNKVVGEKSYTNVYINRLLGEGDPAAALGFDDSEKIPF